MDSFGIILFGVHSASWIYKFVFFPKDIFDSTFFFLSIWDSNDTKCYMYFIGPQDSQALFVCIFSH